MDVLRGPRHLARIALKRPHHTLALAASPDGALVAVSDASCVRLYRVRLCTAYGGSVRNPHHKLALAALSSNALVATRSPCPMHRSFDQVRLFGYAGSCTVRSRSPSHAY